MNDTNTTHEDEETGDVKHPAAESISVEAEPMSIEAQLEAALAERNAKHDQWIRSQAELENYRKRVQKEAEQNRLYHTISLVRDLLPGLDNLQRAITAAENSQDTGELIQGVKMVAKQFEDILSSHSVLPIEAIGNPFDPNLHEAVQQFPSADHPSMTIIEELERGYVLNERVVRPSKVIVSSGPPQTDTEESDE